MTFAVAAFFAVFLLLLYVYLELQGRKKRQLEPSSIKNLWIYSQKSKTPNARYSAFLFAAVALFFFQLWEGFLRFLVQKEGPVGLNILGFLIVLGLLIYRLRALGLPRYIDLRLGRFWVVVLFMGFSLLLTAWGTMFCLPWIYWRSRFLPARF